jgi:TolB-like protein/Tfp pilus assembly protein PilF
VIGVLAIAALAVGGYYFYSRPDAQLTSIAVMPFVNASGSADLEYLSDGMTESLMNSLSQLPNLSVKARSSVFRYKGKEIEPVAVGTELNVQALLNGRVVQRGDQLTLSLDLVDARTGNQLWGENYNRKVGDLAALQNEIARDVSQKLRHRLTAAQQQDVTKNQTQNTDAYQLYLQGRYHWNKRTGEGNEKAAELYQQALEKDPSYAMAYVGLAESHVTGFEVMRERGPKIIAAAQKALELDPTLGEPYAALGQARWTYDLDYPAAEAAMRRAVELNPNYATGYHWLGDFLVFQGRFEEGFAEYRKALELDPFSFAISTDLGFAYRTARQYDRAIDHLKKLIELDPNYVRTHFYLSRVYEDKGMFEEAITEREKGMLLDGADPARVAKGKQVMLEAYRAGGAKGYWQQGLEFIKEDLAKGEDVEPADLAAIYSRLGEKDKAFEWLEKVFEEREEGRQSFNVAPAWDNLRGDPRFAEILRRVGFSQ